MRALWHPRSIGNIRIWVVRVGGMVGDQGGGVDQGGDQHEQTVRMWLTLTALAAVLVSANA